jgi:hypothetical protein
MYGGGIVQVRYLLEATEALQLLLILIDNTSVHRLNQHPQLHRHHTVVVMLLDVRLFQPTVSVERTLSTIFPLSSFHYFGRIPVLLSAGSKVLHRWCLQAFGSKLSLS